MATWPATGVTDWNAKMLAYLAIAHSTTGYDKYPIDGTGTTIYIKYLTGTLDEDSETSVAHGITGVDNILSITTAVYNSNTSQYNASGFLAVASADNSYYVNYDGTNVIFKTVGTYHQGEKYRIRIDYIL